MNIGNIQSSDIILNEMQGSNGQQNWLLSQLGSLFSRIFEWVYEFSQPFAAEAGRSLQAWWHSQKADMVNAAMQWLDSQQDNLSSTLQSVLGSYSNNSIKPQ